MLHIRDLARHLTRRGQLGHQLLLPLRQPAPPRRRITRRRFQPHPRYIGKLAAHCGVLHQRGRQHRLAAATHSPHAYQPPGVTGPFQQGGTQLPEQFEPHHMVRRQRRPRPPHAARDSFTTRPPDREKQQIRPAPMTITEMIIQLVGHNHDLAACGLSARAA